MPWLGYFQLGVEGSVFDPALHSESQRGISLRVSSSGGGVSDRKAGLEGSLHLSNHFRIKSDETLKLTEMSNNYWGSTRVQTRIRGK